MDTKHRFRNPLVAESARQRRRGFLPIAGAVLLMSACLGQDPPKVAETQHGIGIATLDVSGPAMAQSGNTFTYTLLFTASMDNVTNAVLTFSLEDLNDLADADDTGLAEDAEEDYGNGGGLQQYRPVIFEDASNAPNGTVPSKPAQGATTGDVVWNLGTLPPGFSGTVTITMTAPTGTINGKTIAAAATLVHDDAPGGITADNAGTPTVVSAVEGYRRVSATSFSNVGPGTTGITTTFYVRNDLRTDPNTMDAENVTLTITGNSGTCVPIFQGVQINGTLTPEYTYQITAPAPGTQMTVGNDLSIHFDRLPYTANSGVMGAVITLDLPVGCVDGEQIVMHPELRLYEGTINDETQNDNSQDLLIDITLETCRLAAQRTLRVQSGNPIMDDYNAWPGPQESFINDGSARPGEYLMGWAPLGGGSLRTHTVVLDASYYLYPLPAGLTFHGVRQYDFGEVYKDCNGDALDPDDPAFDHVDPTVSGWNPVAQAWTGPFTVAPNDADPTAVVAGAQCRLLAVKRNDSPVGQGPDYGSWLVRGIFRVCDGSYGCAQPAVGTTIDMSPARIFTWYNATIRECPQPGGYRVQVGADSFPIVEVTPVLDAVPAGELAAVLLTPGNWNRGSEYVDGRWYIDLYDLRNEVDLDAALSQVVLNGTNWPDPDQNIAGQFCDPTTDITFTPPDAANCNNPGDAGCLAWWSVPAACQPPNGYFRPGPSANDNEYVQYLKFRLEVPIFRTVPADTILTFRGQARQSDGVTPGADNAADVSRWPATNYEDTGDIRVLPAPAVQLNKQAPATWTSGSLMYYTLDVSNLGNVPLEGLYVVDELPRAGVNGGTFTPVYGRVHVNLDPDNPLPFTDAIIEESTDATCFTAPLTATWSLVGTGMEASALPGYTGQTDAVLSPMALCFRMRLQNPAVLRSGGTFFMAAEATLTGAAMGDLLVNRALVGADPSLGGTVTLPVVNTNPVTTTVSNSPAIRVDKSFTIDRQRAGYIRWTLRYWNASGVVVNDVSVVDTLPNEVFYDSLVTPLDPGETCTDGMGCPVINTNMNGTGGQVRWTIASLDPYDGATGSGTDEGVVEIWTRNDTGLAPNTMITNCADATAMGALVQPPGCATAQTIDFDVDKSITGAPMSVPVGDPLEYVILVTNNTATARYVTVYDQIPAEASYVAGTLLINGLLAPDSFVMGNTLDYDHPSALPPGESLEVRFTVQVNAVPAGDILNNTAVATGCTNPLLESSCAPSLASVEIGVTVTGGVVDTDGDGVPDGMDADPNNPNICRDVDADGCDDCTNTGADGSGGDVNDDGPDQDGDGICDVTDDSDGDGVVDGEDADPNDPNVCRDVDVDGCDDCTNTGANGSGGDVNDDGPDQDGDGVCDDTDDSDGDGVVDGEDTDPNDPNICRDVDMDTCDDCSITGADGSGGDVNNDGPDANNDGICDGNDDSDGDGVVDGGDTDPNDPNVCRDVDDDGCDDCTNTGADGSGGDVDDDGPDQDGDGICDATDDSDGDGVVDGEDTDPNDPRVCRDVDNDTCDDCSITGADGSGGDVDNDGPDANNDGICDAGQDIDSDGDGVNNGDDEDPNDPYVCRDEDGDGCNDCSITGPDGSGGDILNDGEDEDGDGICNLTDPDFGVGVSGGGCSATGQSAPPSWIFLACFLLLGLIRRRRESLTGR